MMMKVLTLMMRMMMTKKMMKTMRKTTKMKMLLKMTMKEITLAMHSRFMSSSRSSASLSAVSFRLVSTCHSASRLPSSPL